MEYEKIFIREDGNKVKVIVYFIPPDYKDKNHLWQHSVSVKEKGKYKWSHHTTIRATEQKILVTKLEFWNSFKPEN